MNFLLKISGNKKVINTDAGFKGAVFTDITLIV